jgi:hypothetical protein
MCKQIHGREGICVITYRIRSGRRLKSGLERLALGFTSPLVFVASGTLLVSHFIAWKSFIFESKRFGAFIKSILVDIILSKYFIIL